MSNNTIEALHDVHTATNDVLKGYREMQVRAEPEIQAIIDRLTDMHQKHAAEQAAELSRVRESGENDASLQGTLNKAVIVVRDWVSDLDRDVLPSVRMGEESLRDKYNDALTDSGLQRHPSVVSILKHQLASINNEIARLPEG